MERYRSTITIHGIDANHPALAGLDPAVQEIALKIIDELDLDKNGKLDSTEVLKGIAKAAKTNYSLKQLLRKHHFIFGVLAFVIVLLCLSTFGTSVAAALLTKETTVSADGNMKVYGSDETVKTVPTGRRIEALAPVAVTQDSEVEGQAKSLGCLSVEEAELLKLESFFTPTVLASPDGTQHSIQAHDIESTEDGGFVLTDMSGMLYHVEKSSDCQTGVVDRHGRLLGSSASEKQEVAVFKDKPRCPVVECPVVECPVVDLPNCGNEFSQLLQSVLEGNGILTYEHGFSTSTGRTTGIFELSWFFTTWPQANVLRTCICMKWGSDYVDCH